MVPGSGPLGVPHLCFQQLGPWQVPALQLAEKEWKTHLIL